VHYTINNTFEGADADMNNIEELIPTAAESDSLFNQEFCFFNQLGDINEKVAKKNRELFAENHNLRSEIERLKKINFIDAMTGIYNKKYMKIRLGEEFAKARRYGSPLSSIFIDLDDFKAINDTYGHILGDKLLKEVASVLEGLCRSEDVLARFGGEEFVILMSNTSASEAVIFAERIRKKVEGHVFFYKSIEISVSASLGASTLNSDDLEYVSDPEELISMADRAMYIVKQNGKNNSYHLPFYLPSSNPKGKNLPVRENFLPYSHTCLGFFLPIQIIYKAFYFIFNWKNLKNMWIKNT
jgi:diguanylate cyclase (GGDEF)-like protein